GRAVSRDRSRQSRQEQRALEELEKGLRRGDLALAASSYVSLPEPARAPFTQTLAEKFRAEVAAQHRASRWLALRSLALQAEAAPELLSSGASREQEREAWWSLLWGSGLSGDWTRASLAWARIEGDVAAAAPSLSGAIGAWVASRGEPEDASL